jgi:hypothetical protein
MGRGHGEVAAGEKRRGEGSPAAGRTVGFGGLSVGRPSSVGHPRPLLDMRNGSDALKSHHDRGGRRKSRVPQGENNVTYDKIYPVLQYLNREMQVSAVDIAIAKEGK